MLEMRSGSRSRGVFLFHFFNVHAHRKKLHYHYSHFSSKVQKVYNIFSTNSKLHVSRKTFSPNVIAAVEICTTAKRISVKAERVARGVVTMMRNQRDEPKAASEAGAAAAQIGAAEAKTSAAAAESLNMRMLGMVAKQEAAMAELRAELTAFNTKAAKQEAAMKAELAAVNARGAKQEAAMKAELAAANTKAAKQEAAMKAELAAVNARGAKQEAAIKTLEKSEKDLASKVEVLLSESCTLFVGQVRTAVVRLLSQHIFPGLDPPFSNFNHLLDEIKRLDDMDNSKQRMTDLNRALAAAKTQLGSLRGLLSTADINARNLIAHPACRCAGCTQRPAKKCLFNAKATIKGFENSGGYKILTEGQTQLVQVLEALHRNFNTSATAADMLNP